MVFYLKLIQHSSNRKIRLIVLARAIAESL